MQEIANNTNYLAKTHLDMQAPRSKAGRTPARSLSTQSATPRVSLSPQRRQRSLPARSAALLLLLLYMLLMYPATLGVARVYSGLRRTEIYTTRKILIHHYFEVICKPKKLSPVLVSHGTVIFEVGAAIIVPVLVFIIFFIVNILNLLYVGLSHG